MAVDPNVLKELQDWNAFRQQFAPAGDISKLPQAQKDAINAKIAAMTPEEYAKFNGETLSPEAHQYSVGSIDPQTGKPRTGVGGEHFDATTNKIEKNKGFWQLPETYKMLALMGGSVAAPFVLPALAGLGGAEGGAGGALAGGSSSGAALTGGVTGATTAAEAAAASAAVPGLASSAIPTMTGLGGTGALMGSSAAPIGSVLGGAGGLTSGLVGKTTLGKVGDLLNVGAGGMGSAADMMAKNRSVGGELGLGAEREYTNQVNANTSAQQAYENELLARAKEESSQRNDALKNVYRESYTQNAKPGPFNVAGLAANSPAYMEALHNLSTQGSGKLAKGPAYDTDTYGKLTSTQIAPDQMFDRQKFMDKYGNPSTGEKILGYGSAGLGTLGKVINIFKPRS